MGTTCCYATQDKAWLTGPGGERWEVYTVLADSDTFGASPKTLTGTQDTSAGVCCRSDRDATKGDGQPTAATDSAGTACC